MKNNNVERTLKIAIILTSVIFVVELAGSFASGSLSLLGDAGHMLRDVFALAVSLSAVMIAKKLPTKEKTFGYHRVEILAALLNGILLIVISGWIFAAAYIRFFTPAPIQSFTMLVVASIGLVVNVIVAFSLRGHHDLNVRSAFFHVLTDLLSSVAVVFAAIWIFFTGQTIVDPILGTLIAILVLISAFNIIRDSIHILLGFAPKDVNFEGMIKDMESVSGVDGVNNVHLWTLCSNVNILDAHVLTKEPSMTKIEKMKDEIKQRLGKYNIRHATLEFECEECRECKECSINNSKVREMKH
ncbi:MAG: cation diffusion facilitator family transporter [Candidatus Aenigmarchaeota archaeon]|nr:cation diffusion facilitator family transporter [Candidatus Aenigmarchaeota archaeon]